MKLGIIFLLFAILSWGQNCKYKIKVNNFVGQVGNTEQVVTHPFTLSRKNTDSDCENFRVYFSKGDANSYNRQAYRGGGASIDYNLYSDSGMNNILKDFNDTTNGDYIAGSLAQNNSDYNFNFFGQIVDLDSIFSSGFGNFRDQIQLNIYSVSANGSLVYQNSKNLNIRIKVPKFIEISLGRVGSTHDPSQTQYIMNFGTIQNNESLSANLIVKGNVGFDINMSSVNGGRLVNGNSFITYLISLGSSGNISLTNPGQVYFMDSRCTGTTDTGESYPINVSLGALSTNAAAGNYEDTVTITVSAW